MYKKIIALLLTVFTFLCFSACTTYEQVTVDNFYLYYSQKKDSCFVGSINFEKGQSTEFFIPNEYNGIKVKALGGDYGCPIYFQVSINNSESYFEYEFNEDSRYSTHEKNLYEDFYDNAKLEIIDITFTVNLPDYLETIDPNRLLCDLVDCHELINNGEKTVYIIRPIYYFNISPSNNYFYTENGKIYKKNTNELITGITYHPFVNP